MRGGEWNQKGLESFSLRLSKENVEDVLAALVFLGESARDPHEPAIPDMGTILSAVRSVNHPLRHLREIVTRLGRIFGHPVDEDLLQAFQDVAGHRIDADLECAYRSIARNSHITRMPTTGQFLEACGILRVRRDGSRPE